jgi:hypothetical protein
MSEFDFQLVSFPFLAVTAKVDMVKAINKKRSSFGDQSFHPTAPSLQTTSCY